jgi:hypothetical protein
MNIHDGVQCIIFPGQQHFGLGSFDEFFEILKLGCKIVADGFALAGEVHQRFDVIDLAADLSIEIESFFEARSLLQNLSGTLLIGPKVRLLDDLLKIVELTLLG